MIERLDDCFIDIMKRADELGRDGRIAVVGPVIHETFDLTSMARSTIGRTWRDLSSRDKERWVDSFSRYTIWKLADQFNRYTGQSFVIEGHKPASQQTLIVMTRIIKPGNEDISLHYRMQEKVNGWRVVDVYGKGKISEVALRRSEYAAILREGGFEHLIESVSAFMKQADDLAEK